MKTPLERLEGRVQKALVAIDEISKITTSNSYPTTPAERIKILDTIYDRAHEALKALEAGQDGINFKL